MSAVKDEGILATLRAAKLKGKGMAYAVVGAGNGGLAMAGHLGLMGFPVTLYNRTAEHLAGVRWRGGIDLKGAVSGFGPVARVSSDIAEALEGADVVMVVTPSTAHRGLAEAMAPHLKDGQLVVLNPGRTGGALEFRKALRDSGAPGKPLIAEAQTFIYASRAVSRHEAYIFRVKSGVPLATLPSFWTPEALGLLGLAYPQFSAGGDVLSTGMENIGAVFHPALTILNAGWIEGTGGDFDYYLDGITPSIAKLLERVDAERLAVARALGVRSLSAREWLFTSFDSPGRDLYEAIHNTASFRGIRAPENIGHRSISEDVPMSLVPISSLGAALGVPTPMIDMVIDLGSTLHDRDYRGEGRSLARLGLEGLSAQDIRALVDEAE
jgi:opine dehydrogenase